MKTSSPLAQPERLKKAIHTLSGLRLTDKELENALRVLILRRRGQLSEPQSIPVKKIHLVRERNTLRHTPSGQEFPVTPQGELDWEKLNVETLLKL